MQDQEKPADIENQQPDQPEEGVSQDESALLDQQEGGEDVSGEPEPDDLEVDQTQELRFSMIQL